MTKYFNSNPIGFYDSEFNTDVPDSAITISDDRHKELFAAQASGKIISADKDGNPIDPVAPDPQIEINAKARKYLRETDWYVVRFAETAEPVPKEITDARAEARMAIKE